MEFKQLCLSQDEPYHIASFPSGLSIWKKKKNTTNLPRSHPQTNQLKVKLSLSKYSDPLKHLVHKCKYNIIMFFFNIIRLP